MDKVQRTVTNPPPQSRVASTSSTKTDKSMGVGENAHQTIVSTGKTRKECTQARGRKEQQTIPTPTALKDQTLPSLIVQPGHAQAKVMYLSAPVR